MKLVSRLEFLKMPIGTIYSRFSPEYSNCKDQISSIQKLKRVILFDPEVNGQILPLNGGQLPLSDLNETNVGDTDFWYETIFPPSINIHDIRSDASEFERTMTSYYTVIWEDVGFERKHRYDIVNGDKERDGEYTQDEQFLIWSDEDLDTFLSSLSPHYKQFVIDSYG